MAMAEVMRYVEVLLPLKLKDTLTYRLPGDPDAVVGIGSWVKVTLRGHAMPGIVVGISDRAPAGIALSAIAEAEPLPDQAAVTADELALWRAVADYYLCTSGEVCKAAWNTALQKQLLLPAKPLKTKRKTKTRKTGADTAGCAGMQDGFPLHPLSDPQQQALAKIRDSFAARKPVLLQGVTGSGKTELYLHLAAGQLAQGRDVLYLVPEIALSKQLQQRLESVFGEQLRIFHSQATVPQRYAVIETLRRDPLPRIILGTRSAVFLPFRTLGLVIVDEEHDRSYKQEDLAPRYNGRDTALMLAAQRGADVLLGSATPSLEALYNVESGKFARVSLPLRYHGGSDPVIEVIDTAQARRLGNMQGAFSRKLLKEMSAVLAARQQILVFRSRRAYAPTVQCEACGEVVMCPNCHVPLSYHKFNTTLSCHYCGYHRPYTLRCPACGETALAERGAGTERIEEELREIFPDCTVARFDADTTERKSAQEQLIRDFAGGNIDILVGTQMITKGFDFERLAMVVIVSADSLFAVQDFRSDERAFQLLMQLMGRAGRRGQPARLVIQTFQPDHPVVKRLQQAGAGANAQMEENTAALLAERKAFRYPPYVRMLSVTVKDKYEGRVWNVCRLIKEAAGEVGIADIAGPVVPAVDVVAGEHIAQFWIKLPRTRSLASVKKAFSERIGQIDRDFKGQTRIILDVDPA